MAYTRLVIGDLLRAACSRQYDICRLTASSGSGQRSLCRYSVSHVNNQELQARESKVKPGSSVHPWAPYRRPLPHFGLRGGDGVQIGAQSANCRNGTPLAGEAARETWPPGQVCPGIPSASTWQPTVEWLAFHLPDPVLPTGQNDVRMGCQPGAMAPLRPAKPG